MSVADSTSLAHYYFIPTVREGLASYIMANATGERAEIKARLVPLPSDAMVDAANTDCNCAPSAGEAPDPDCKCVALYGPGDVLGFDSSVVSRTDPRMNVWDYEPNYMPLVEFSEPDLPWRFTAAMAEGASTSGKLTPWITLIVLRAEEFIGLGESLPADQQKNALPIRWIEKVQIAALPDLDYAWMWAHVQVTAESTLIDAPEGVSLEDALRSAISAEPETAESHVVARLICPRRLSERTKYTAFIVPTFKLGLVAAELAIRDAGDKALTIAWKKTDAGPIDLPYYYKWEFATAKSGDFESLVRQLEPRSLAQLGKRPMDCSSTLYDLPPVPADSDAGESVLGLEGALMSPDFAPSKWRNEASTPARDAYQSKLASLLNLPTTLLSQQIATPPVTPPVFGRRHSGRPTVDSSKLDNWQNDANLDPRQRAAAGFGALVVQKEQEPLMASLWDQLGDIDQANEIVRRGQLGVDASKAIYKRVGVLGLSDFLWTTTPVSGRIRAQVPTEVAPTTIAQYLATSPIPRAAFDPAFRRMLRRRGGPRKRQTPVGPPSSGEDLLSRLNRGELAAAGRAPDLIGMPSMCASTDLAIAALERAGEPARRAKDVFRINGRVIDSRTRRGLAGAIVKIEAWDKDLFFDDLVGSTLTDERGSFRLEFDPSYFKEGPFDQRPDVYFRVFRGARQIRVTEPPLLRNLAPGDTDVVIAVKLPFGPPRDAEFHISGRVIDRSNGKGVPWLRVEAWDKDPFFNDLVGSAVTNTDGTFSINFDKTYYKEWILDDLPDLFFKVFRGDRLLVTTQSSVMANVRPGNSSVVVEISPPIPPTHPPGPPGIFDFCEAAITCQALMDATSTGPASLHRGTANAICGALGDWLSASDPPATGPTPADLDAVYGVVKLAIAPSVTIPARVMSRITQLLPGIHQRGPLGRIESEVHFPQPMYEPLAAISQDLILPGVETVPQNTASLLKVNRRFIEAYMLGLNDSLSSEALWRGAPVYLWTTFCRRFWDVRGLVDSGENSEFTLDIDRLTRWEETSELGDHDPRNTGGGAPPDRAVLMVRGNLLKRYPNTLVYLVEALSKDTPALREYDPKVVENRVWPIFSGSLAPDLTFLGFDKTPAELRGGGSSEGYFIVLEERLAEPRFGFDDSASPALSSENWWYDLAWANLKRGNGSVDANTYIDDAAPVGYQSLTPQWRSSSATTANICLQRPVRICIHASKMLSGPPVA